MASESSKIMLAYRRGYYDLAMYIYKMTIDAGMYCDVAGRREYYAAMRDVLPTATYPLLVGKWPHSDGLWNTPADVYEFIARWMTEDALQFDAWFSQYVGEKDDGMAARILSRAEELAAVAVEQGKIKQGQRTDLEHHDNIMKSSVTEQGTSTSYTLRRLARNHPELLERFAAGELTANQAAIHAGFRKPTWTAPCEPDALARSIVKKFGPDFARQLKDAL
jgi:hypothetical protein